MALRSHLGLGKYRRTLCLLPTHFGHGLICNALFPWLSGQELFILPPFKADAMMRLGKLIDDHRITFLSSSPAVWRLALKTAKPPGGRNDRAGLRRVRPALRQPLAGNPAVERNERRRQRLRDHRNRELGGGHDRWAMSNLKTG